MKFQISLVMRLNESINKWELKNGSKSFFFFFFMINNFTKWIANVYATYFLNGKPFILYYSRNSQEINIRK